MKLSPRFLKPYKDIALLALKYRHTGLNSRFAQETTTDSGNGEGLQNARELPDQLERMGPTFIKLGQLLSSRVDLLPPVYLKSLARLHDHVKPFPFAEVKPIVESELGVKLNKAFSAFEQEPMAAASLGQVHRAALHDGRIVAVKVQRPNIVQQVDEDFAALENIAGFLERHTQIGRRYQLRRILEEFENTLAHELDYRREASNMIALAANLKSFSLLEIPLPVAGYTTLRVLTMSYIEGRKITELSSLAWLEVDGGALAEELFRAYLKQILVDGIFHADPHPGNVQVTPGGRIALLDLGMVGNTSPAMQENLLKLLLAISEGQSDDAAQIGIRISRASMDFDEAAFRHKIGQLVAEEQNATLREINIGKLVLQVGRAAADTGLDVPTEITLLGKTLLQLDQIGRILAPKFDPNESIRRNAREILSQRLKSTFTEGKAFSALLETKEFLGALPSRLNKILDAVGATELNVNVKPSETEFLVESARKVANRVTSGLVLAALIVGAALLMRVETTFRLFGYPGLAMICFLVAGAGGLWLLFAIFWSDHKSKQESRRARY